MAMGGVGADPQTWLLCRIGTRLCAVPLDHVVETMRVLPIAPVVGAPRFVSGVCIIRGSPVPVVDAAALFGEAEGGDRRLVTLAVGARRVALAVGEVIAMRTIEARAWVGLPPLLREAAGDTVEALGVLDGELLLLLDAVRLVPEAASDALGSAGPAS